MAKPRWFRFSLRTLFVLLTLFGVWLGWQMKWIRERREFLQTEAAVFAAHKLPYNVGTSLVSPWFYAVLGEHEQLFVSLYVEGVDREHLTAEDLAKVNKSRQLFPETVYRHLYTADGDYWTDPPVP